MELELGNSVQVLTAEDGFEAIDVYKSLIKNGKQNLLRGVFMDYHMPKCSGLEAIQAIRKIEKNNIPVLQPCYIVAFTADLNDQSQMVLLDAGANEVMAKPTPTRQLEDTCVRLMNQQQIDQPPSKKNRIDDREIT